MVHVQPTVRRAIGKVRRNYNAITVRIRPGILSPTVTFLHLIPKIGNGGGTLAKLEVWRLHTMAPGYVLVLLLAPLDSTYMQHCASNICREGISSLTASRMSSIWNSLSEPLATNKDCLCTTPHWSRNDLVSAKNLSSKNPNLCSHSSRPHLECLFGYALPILLYEVWHSFSLSRWNYTSRISSPKTRLQPS